MDNPILELQRFKQVNRTESLDQLAEVIESFADNQGQIRGIFAHHNAKQMADACRHFTGNKITFLTTNWGIRQQAVYLYWENKGL
jgi:hypothetical protein